MVHHAAARGFERAAGAYRLGRPTYHPALIERVVGLIAGGVVAEVGAGTGIFTAELVAAGLEIIAIEPVDAMRSTLRRDLPDVLVVEGTAEAMPIADASVDAVLAAQSFHWFDARRALDETVRVLRTGGRLITVWNVRDENVPWVARYGEVLERYAGSTPRYRSLDWRRAIDGDDRFVLVDEWAIDHPYPTDPGGVVHRAMSTSFIAMLDRDEQGEVADEIAAIVEPLGAHVEFPYRCELQAWRLQPPGQLTLA